MKEARSTRHAGMHARAAMVGVLARDGRVVCVPVEFLLHDLLLGLHQNFHN
jgi:hypothetical protein